MDQLIWGSNYYISSYEANTKNFDTLLLNAPRTFAIPTFQDIFCVGTSKIFPLAN
jgi:hypothetical protein